MFKNSSTDVSHCGESVVVTTDEICKDDTLQKTHVLESGNQDQPVPTMTSVSPDEGFGQDGHLTCSECKDVGAKFNCPFAHAVYHLPKSNTLEALLANKHSETFSEYGGSIGMLTQVSEELGIRLRYRVTPLVTEPPSCAMFLEMSFPFKSDSLMAPKKNVVFGTGRDSPSAKLDAANRALSFLKDMCAN